VDQKTTHAFRIDNTVIAYEQPVFFVAGSRSPTCALRSRLRLSSATRHFQPQPGSG
jgi:hypothetical protein